MLISVMERIEKRGNCFFKNSSVLFPLTGNCVFDLSHHTHLVIACEVSLLPKGERRKFAIAALTRTPARTMSVPKIKKKKIVHFNYSC